MSELTPCVICRRTVVNATVHAKCNELLEAGFSIEGARMEAARLAFLSDTLKPAIRTAVLQASLAAAAICAAAWVIIFTLGAASK